MAAPVYPFIRKVLCVLAIKKLPSAHIQQLPPPRDGDLLFAGLWQDSAASLGIA